MKNNYTQQMFLTSFPIDKFLHVIASVTLVGINIASFFYVLHSHQKKKLLRYALTVSFYADALYFVLLSIIIATAILLQNELGLSTHIAWIKVAHTAMLIIIVIWLLQMVIRIISYRQKQLVFRRTYMASAIIIWIIFILVVHDASTHSTWITIPGGDT